MYGSLVLLITIAISSIPVIVVYIWFRVAKYQLTLIRFLIIMITGATAFFPALILQDLLNFTISSGGRTELFYHVFIRGALTEELSRLLVLSIYFFITERIVKNNTEQPVSWNSVKTGAAAGLVAGLGFAILENSYYAISDINILLLRTITAAPLHAACGSRIGMAAVMFKKNPFQSITRVLSAVAIHGIYNIMISRSGLPSIIAILIAFSALINSIIIISSSGNTEDNPQLNP